MATNVLPPPDDPPDHETGLLVRLTALGADVEALRDTETWRSWLAVAAKFHRYSFGNQWLITVQRPEATRVAGYRKWQELGRQVRKGERGISICAPITRKDAEGKSHIVAFKVVKVFDVDQTDGDELPEHPPWPMATGDADELRDSLVATFTPEPISVIDFVHHDDNGGPPAARGWYDPVSKRITIRQSVIEDDDGPVRVSTGQQCKTILHELGHHFDTDRNASDRETKEIVAESVAWLCATNLGLSVDEGATAYLASWGADTAGILVAGRRIVAAVKAIETELWAADVVRKESA